MVKDQAQLGGLKIPAMRDMTIERTLWQLKLRVGSLCLRPAPSKRCLFDRSIFPDERLDRAANV
jgi:hypothetical protein